MPDGGARFGANGISWLDVRLGVRMLVKYPGLTLLGGVGMAVAIAIGACFFALFYSYLQPTVPLEEGERVVVIDVRDRVANTHERRILHDFAAWRRELRSVVDVGAFQNVDRNLFGPDGTAAQVRVAEMTASGFRLARIPPLLGRTLVAADEAPGGPPVVVIGHDVWRTRFASDPRAVGRTLRLGNTVHVVVGVMPQGFAFPVSHALWTPLRANPADYARRAGPALTVFGRLAPGATLSEAGAELEAVGRRAAADFPATHERLHPRVLPYTAAFMDGTPLWALHLAQLLVSMLLVVISVNVAILVYARTATRQGEIAVRTALGASRGRIVGQLFVEALVLSAVASALGLAIAALVLRQVDAILLRELAHFGGPPFWMDFGLSAGTVAYVIGLGMLAAVIVGIIPGLQATGRPLQAGLRQLGGGTGLRMGRTWTVLIIAQVALTMTVMPAAVVSAWKSARYAGAQPSFAAASFLSAELNMDDDVPAGAGGDPRGFDARYGERLAELARRLEAEPAVVAVTFGNSLPGQEGEGRIEVERLATPGGEASRDAGAGRSVRVGKVDVGYFDAFGVAVLAGRGFGAGDLGAGAVGVVASRTFARQLAGEGTAVGRRFRYLPPRGEAAGAT
ncbi:MAG TPA: ABC transporter permease, partial [Longimicrobium sp.]|nr:ABC transporter permease [Longimicrobium sp.]